MNKANKILQEAGIITEQKLSKDEQSFINDEMIASTVLNFLLYSKKGLYNDMEASVGDDSIASPEAKSYIKDASKKMLSYIKKFKG